VLGQRGLATKIGLSSGERAVKNSAARIDYFDRVAAHSGAIHVGDLVASAGSGLAPNVYRIAEVKHFSGVLFAFILKFGGIGLVLLGILDSSFLFAPFGNDLLVVALVVRNRSIMAVLYYAVASTAGSVLGCVLLDYVFRKAGEKGLDKHLPRKRLDYVKKKVNQSAGWALAVASLAPPPFPFTPFVMAAAALEYPRKKLLTAIGAARLVRFTIVGMLALRFGNQILVWANYTVVQVLLFGLIVICTVGSIVSAYRWIKRSRTATEVGAR
jgi:membrane protein YqaA with SNARE-associated domain